MVAELRSLRLRLYEEFLDARSTLPIAGRFMPYRRARIPDPLGVEWIIYGQMLDEFSRELANIVNRLTNHVHMLESWEVVFKPLSDNEKMEAIHEFVDVLGSAAVGLPYVIKSRFAYACAHLCHQANRAKKRGDWKDEFPAKNALYLNDVEPFGRDWISFRAFKLSVEAIGGRAFRTATMDFRNAYNHRFAPRFVLGITNFVQRQVDPASGEISYAIGGNAPLSLTTVASLLAKERDLSYVAFDAFQALIREHEAALFPLEEDHRSN